MITEGPGSGGSGLGETWVDLCSQPYLISDGQDATTALQAVADAANAANVDTTAWFSQEGDFGIDGPLQTAGGSNAQILFGIRHFASGSGSPFGSLRFRIAGPTPPPLMARGRSTETPEVPSYGARLHSNMNTSGGAIFQCRGPDSGFGDWHLLFQDICIRGPANPQGNGIDGRNFTTMGFRGHVSVDTDDPIAAKTGTGRGVMMPNKLNDACNHQIGSMEIMGYPNGLQAFEHCVFDDLYIGRCTSAYTPGAGDHWNVFKRLLVQDCVDAIVPTNPTGHDLIDAFVDFGDAAGCVAAGHLINDPNNVLFGEVRFGPYQAAPALSVIGGANCRVVNYGQPIGTVAAPGIPASGTPLVNGFGRNAWVIVSGGTVSAISVDGVATGLTSGQILVPGGKTVTLTYTAAPTWAWWLF